MAAERLQKILSAAGIASRRAAEEIILEGRVTVNGRRVTELGAKADPAKDHVKVDGKLVRLPEQHRYVLLNKPRGIVVTKDDPEGRPTVFTMLSGRVSEKLVPVGRLDTDSEGLLILTNDGALVQKLTHPSGGCRKVYEVKVSGVPSPEQMARLARGVRLPDGVKTAPAELELMETTPEKGGVGGNAWVRVTLGEGRSRQIRRMFDLVGHPVSKLRRVAIGPVRDPKLPPGAFRDLHVDEVRALFAIRAAAGPAPRARKAAPAPAPAPKRAPRAGGSRKETR
jgi:23S rRNA pseudouridine2605 synthase